MAWRKGFTTTLESVLASILFLLFVINVLPGIADSGGEPVPINARVEEVLRSLDRAGELRPLILERDLDGLHQKISRYVRGVQMGIGLSYFDITEGSYTGGVHTRDFSVSKSEARQESLLLWIEEADDIDIDINGEDVLETSTTGFQQVAIGSYTDTGQNTLQIDSDSGDLHYSIEIYNRVRSRSLPDQEVTSLGYIVAGSNNSFQPSEVVVFTWR